MRESRKKSLDFEALSGTERHVIDMMLPNNSQFVNIASSHSFNALDEKPLKAMYSSMCSNIMEDEQNDDQDISWNEFRLINFSIADPHQKLLL